MFAFAVPSLAIYICQTHSECQSGVNLQSSWYFKQDLFTTQRLDSIYLVKQIWDGM